MNNSFISTANRQQLKWLAAISLPPSILMLSLAENSSPLGLFGAVQLIYFLTVVKQCFFGALIGWTSDESGDTRECFLFATHGVIVALAFVWLEHMFAGSIELSLYLMLTFMFIGYFIPLIHSFFYELLFQKR